MVHEIGKPTENQELSRPNADISKCGTFVVFNENIFVKIKQQNNFKLLWNGNKPALLGRGAIEHLKISRRQRGSNKMLKRETEKTYHV